MTLKKGDSGYLMYFTKYTDKMMGTIKKEVFSTINPFLYSSLFNVCLSYEESVGEAKKAIIYRSDTKVSKR